MLYFDLFCSFKSCQNGTSVNNVDVQTSYPSTNDNVKIDRDNPVIDVDEDDKYETDSLSADSRNEDNKATTFGGLTQVQKNEVD